MFVVYLFESTNSNISSCVLDDVIQRLYQSILYFQDVIQFHGAWANVSRIKLYADLLYRTSTKPDIKCGKDGHKFIHATVWI